MPDQRFQMAREQLKDPLVKAGAIAAGVSAVATMYSLFKASSWGLHRVAALYRNSRASVSVVTKASASTSLANYLVSVDKLLKSSRSVSVEQFNQVLRNLDSNPAVANLTSDERADVMVATWRLSRKLPKDARVYPLTWAVHDDAGRKGLSDARVVESRNFVTSPKHRRLSGVPQKRRASMFH